MSDWEALYLEQARRFIDANKAARDQSTSDLARLIQITQDSDAAALKKFTEEFNERQRSQLDELAGRNSKAREERGTISSGGDNGGLTQLVEEYDDAAAGDGSGEPESSGSNGDAHSE